MKVRILIHMVGDDHIVHGQFFPEFECGGLHELEQALGEITAAGEAWHSMEWDLKGPMATKRLSPLAGMIFDAVTGSDKLRTRRAVVQQVLVVSG